MVTVELLRRKIYKNHCGKYIANRRTARWTGLQGCDSDPFRAKKNQTHTHLTPFLSITSTFSNKNHTCVFQPCLKGVPAPVVFEVVDDYHFENQSWPVWLSKLGNVINWGEMCAGFRAKPFFLSGGRVDKTIQPVSNLCCSIARKKQLLLDELWWGF